MAGPSAAGPQSTYSVSTGFIFLFNLMVGAGALTIPHAFAQVGIIYGSIGLILLCKMSYISSTFVIETMSSINALMKLKHGEVVDHSKEMLEEMSPEEAKAAAKKEKPEDSVYERAPLLVNGQELIPHPSMAKFENGITLNYEINEKVELASMAEHLLTPRGLQLFYATVVIYLFGDLTIYAAAVPKSLREITCGKPEGNPDRWDCVMGLDSTEVYRLYVILFACMFGPFAFGNMQKTKMIQLVTTFMRHASFLLMIVIAFAGIMNGSGRSAHEVVEYEHPLSIPKFIGVAIYSFMNQHSLPGIITPINDKSRVHAVVGVAFVFVLAMYLALSTSSTFRFQPTEIYDVYTLNFKDFSIRPIAIFLQAFPVFTLSAVFPMIAITLRENLRTLLGQKAMRMDVRSVARGRSA